MVEQPTQKIISLSTLASIDKENREIYDRPVQLIYRSVFKRRAIVAASLADPDSCTFGSCSEASKPPSQPVSVCGRFEWGRPGNLEYFSSQLSVIYCA